MNDVPDDAIAPPAAISPDHELSAFRCGNDALDDWLRYRALKSEGRSARTYVVARGGEVIGYYCLSTGAARRADVPSKLARNMPDTVPLILIGRLAIDAKHHGKGLGAALLRDALRRSVQLAEIAGARAVIVHAIDESALAFYVKYGFTEFPTGTRAMFLPIETIVKALG